MSDLTVLDCEGCGSCCRHVGTPPGFSFFYAPPEHAAWARSMAWEGDAVAHDSAPAEARAILADYYAALHKDETPDRVALNMPCLWLGEDGRCRFHEHRPDVCREFEIGSDECHFFREEQGIYTIGGAV